MNYFYRMELEMLQDLKAFTSDANSISSGNLEIILWKIVGWDEKIIFQVWASFRALFAYSIFAYINEEFDLMMKNKLNFVPPFVFEAITNVNKPLRSIRIQD